MAYDDWKLATPDEYESAQERDGYIVRAVSVDSLLADGRFVVVEDVPVYCRHTDALLGSQRVLISDHGTREEAEEAAAAHEDEETSCFVLPIEPPAWFDACPGCGCRPGDGRTEGCSHELGCGYWCAVQAEAEICF